MHIPDGLLWPIILIVGWAASLGAVGYVARRFPSSRLDDRVPLMGLLAAGIFVAQMLNFPVGGGTSGHLVGAALATIVLGFCPAVLILTVVILVQALLFGDGGITALGINLFNMAVIGCGVTHIVYRLSPEGLKRPAIFVSAWLAVFVGALAAATELGLSYSASGGEFGIPFAIAMPAMLGYHAVIGVGEGILTLGIFGYLWQLIPGTFQAKAPEGI